MAKRFTFADAKQKIKDLELELSMVKTDLTDKDGTVSKVTSIVIGFVTFGFGLIIGKIF